MEPADPSDSVKVKPPNPVAGDAVQIIVASRQRQTHEFNELLLATCPVFAQP
jgi:hypothetical protein